MKKIVIKFEYNCFPVWQYDDNGYLIDNELPNCVLENTIINKLFVDLQKVFNSLFKDDGVDFRYIGFKEKKLKRQFVNNVNIAINLLKENLSNEYFIENHTKLKFNF